MKFCHISRTVNWSTSDYHTHNVQHTVSIALAVWYDATKDINLAVMKRTAKINSLSNWRDAMVLPYIHVWERNLIHAQFMGQLVMHVNGYALPHVWLILNVTCIVIVHVYVCCTSTLYVGHVTNFTRYRCLSTCITETLGGDWIQGSRGQGLIL